jgi:Tripartite tricarboxylate transporter TctB family
MKVTDQKNFTAGSLYIALGGAVAIGSLGFSIGTAERMGPGFFPLGVGILLAVTGIVLVLGAIGRGATGSRLGSWALKPILIVTAAVIAFGLLLEPGGLLVAVPVLLGVSAFAHPEVSWRTVLASIAILLPMTWLIFAVVLGLQIGLLPPWLAD